MRDTIIKQGTWVSFIRSLATTLLSTFTFKVKSLLKVLLIWNIEIKYMKCKHTNSCSLIFNINYVHPPPLPAA